MQVIGMYGYVDKYDFVIAVAKTLNIMDKSALVIDATADKKYKYIIPAIENKEKYITQYAEVDFAIGFDSYQEVEEYMQEKNIDINLYSYVIIDIENAQMYEKFNSLATNKAYMFIDTNLLSVNKNEELVRKMRELSPESELEFSKVLYRAYMSRAATTYLEDKISNYAVKWTDEVYDISNDEQDTMINIDSQFSGLIDIKRHTKTYLYYMSEFVSKLLGDESSKEIQKQIKRRKN